MGSLAVCERFWPLVAGVTASGTASAARAHRASYWFMAFLDSSESIEGDKRGEYPVGFTATLRAGGILVGAA
jgi:hypothetical protein